LGKASRRKSNWVTGNAIDLQPNSEKASTRLTQLIAPHVAPGETQNSYGALIALGAMAWNLSLFSRKERSALVSDAVRDAAKVGLPLTAQWLNVLIDRKLSLFPSDTRVIEAFDVVEEKDGRFTVLVTTSA